MHIMRKIIELNLWLGRQSDAETMIWEVIKMSEREVEDRLMTISRYESRNSDKIRLHEQNHKYNAAKVFTALLN
jgi:hypothetical protein